MTATILDRVRAGIPLTDIGIVDMHCHVGRYSFAIPDLTAEGFVRAMDRTGVRVMVASHLQCIGGDFSWGNRELLSIAREAPGRILGYMSLWPTSAAEVERETRACFAHPEFVGIKLHNANGFSYDDDALRPAYEAAAARRMPVLYHTWGQAKEFDEIRAVSARYPELSLLLGHAGAGNEAAYFPMVRDCPNVYLELAMSAAPRGLVKRLIDGAGVERVVWGSDVNFINLAHQIGKVAGADLSEPDKSAILAINGQRILDRVTPA